MACDTIATGANCSIRYRDPQALAKRFVHPVPGVAQPPKKDLTKDVSDAEIDKLTE